MRRDALLNEAHSIGRLPMSVAGGVVADGNWPASAGFCGPGSVMLPRFLAFIAPCGGSSGLPKEAARAVAAVIAAPAAAAANIPRREIIACYSSEWRRSWRTFGIKSIAGLLIAV
jgi:hypothetical protein